MRRALLVIFTVLCVLGAAGLAGGYLWLGNAYTKPSGTFDAKIITVERGTSVAGIARQLQNDGLVRYARVFRLGERLFGDKKPLQAGEYRIPANASAQQISEILKSGEQVVYKITVAEGLTSIEVVDLLRDEPLLSGDIKKVPPEGALLPETYHFHRGEKRSAILQRMQDALNKAFEDLWASRNRDLPYKDRNDVLTMASIIEKETSVPAERGRVAGVFVNRLRKGMRLQSDPTVVYGITNGAGPLGRPILRRDLDEKTAYNTYQINGLPPTPIANAGLASIEAALNPVASDDLYFVADGSGGHAFAKTLKEHNANVRKWRKLQRNN